MRPNDTAMDHFRSAYHILRDNAEMTDEMIEQSYCYLAAELTLIQEGLEDAIERSIKERTR